MRIFEAIYSTTQNIFERLNEATNLSLAHLENFALLLLLWSNLGILVGFSRLQ